MYNEKLLEHFSHPHNVGEIQDADGIGQMGDPTCGDMIKVWIKVREDRIVDIKFRAFGCPAAIATCSVMTELAMGKSLDEAAEITDEVVAAAVGGLPPDKVHCSNLSASALYEAIMDYVFESIEMQRRG
jgi:nitrogen fixation NifU-like protein